MVRYSFDMGLLLSIRSKCNKCWFDGQTDLMTLSFVMSCRRYFWLSTVYDTDIFHGIVKFIAYYLIHVNCFIRVE